VSILDYVNANRGISKEIRKEFGILRALTDNRLILMMLFLILFAGFFFHSHRPVLEKSRASSYVFFTQYMSALFTNKKGSYFLT